MAVARVLQCGVVWQPTAGTDSMQRNGYSTTISTRLQVIAGMKEYEAKSLEVRAEPLTILTDVENEHSY